MEQGLSLLELYIFPWAVRLVLALGILLIGRLVARFLTRLGKRAMQASRLDASLTQFLASILYAVLLVAVVLAAIDTLGVNITSFIAIVGAAGLAVGLALKDSLANFASGVMIILFRPFNVGDDISAAGASGTVDEIGLFSTLLRTPDNQRIIMPNALVYKGNIVNHSSLQRRRIEISLAIKGDSELAQAREVILAALRAQPGVLVEPAPEVALNELSGAKLGLLATAWVQSSELGSSRARLLEAVKQALDSAGIALL